jgi:hypothetical protein
VFICGILVGKNNKQLMYHIGEKKYNDFIVGEKFYSVADFIFSSDIIEERNEDYNKLNNTFDIKKLKDINIVYLHTMYKNQFFNLIKDLDNKFIVVTHNSEINNKNTQNLPRNVLKWYSQNVNCEDDRLFSLPIGLENSKWFSNVQKQLKLTNKVKTSKKNKKLVYINHNINTNSKERLEPYQLLNGKSFVTVESGFNGQNYDNYIDQIYNHKFVVCPEGNGIDTHRKWETLYLNSIPIEKRSINNSFYDDLPICIVDNWSDITEDFLNREYDRIMNSKWNLDKLDMLYWLNQISKI